MSDTGLSGRVLALEAVVLDFPSSEDWNTLNNLNSTRYNNIDTALTALRSKVTDLETYIVNLKLSHTDLQRQFTGHSGLHLTGGAHGWHTGLG
jgi:hypothetical protein